MKDHYTVLIVGSGPAGLAAAFWMKDNIPEDIRSGKVSVAIFDKTKYSSGGLLNDGKMNLTPYIGMDDYREGRIDLDTAREHIRFFDDVLLRNGANPDVSGVDEPAIKQWEANLKRRGLELVTETRQRHIGTDKSRDLIDHMQEELEEGGIEFRVKHNVTQVVRQEGGGFQLNVIVGDEPRNVTCDYLVLAPGRSGNQWFRNQLDDFGIDYQLAPIEVGIRIEMVRGDYPIAEVIRDPKVKLTAENGDHVKTFCTNPGGYVRLDMAEQAIHYKGRELRMVNGDGRIKKSSDNTNFAVLNKIDLVKPEGDTEDYAFHLAIAAFRAGGWRPIVQRLGHFMARPSHRSKPIHFGNGERVQPTMPVSRDGSAGAVTPGDIHIIYPSRTIENIAELLRRLGYEMPGVMNPDNLIYAPEIKFQNVTVKVSSTLETDVQRLYVAGNGAGLSSGIIGAASNGILAAKGILQRHYT